MVLYHPWPSLAEEAGSNNIQILRRCSPSSNIPGKTYEFFVKPECVNEYLSVISRVFNRQNSHKNNLLYKYDKTILSWELMSEPMNDAADPYYRQPWWITNWISSVAYAVKTYLAPMQPITVSLYADDLPENKSLYTSISEYSFSSVFSAAGPRTSVKDISAISHIDYVDVHVYTKDPVGIWADMEHWQGALFLVDIKKVAKLNGKPLVVSEFGTISRSYVRNSGGAVVSRIEKSDSVLSGELLTYFSNAWCAGVDGMVFWHVFPELDRLAPLGDPARNSIWTPYMEALLNSDYNVIVVRDLDIPNQAKPAYQLRQWGLIYSLYPDNTPYCSL
jgi:hypothetical protein